ncbi:MAG TPA: prephenate dehydratase [Dehalococcoidia bacterium]|nr:prephenate dehydratase [Dehalococcoidia bacterium]
MSEEVGYLGPPGTFGEQVALLYLQQTGLDARLHPLDSHVEVIRAVDNDEIAYGVVAVENALGGAVPETLDAILAAANVSLCAELTLPVEHHLIAAAGSSLEDIVTVMSHPQALAQCREYLESHLPNASLEAALSTAGAVERAVGSAGVAGIGSRRAAEVYGGLILAESIQDEDQDETRFVVIARHDAPRTGDDKTSIAFAVDHDRPGTLIAALGELSNRGLNMTHIQLRPSRRGLGLYIFLIDFQGHRTDATVTEALAALQAQAGFFRVLGSYPRFKGA